MTGRSRTTSAPRGVSRSPLRRLPPNPKNEPPNMLQASGSERQMERVHASSKVSVGKYKCTFHTHTHAHTHTRTHTHTHTHTQLHQHEQPGFLLAFSPNGNGGFYDGTQAAWSHCTRANRTPKSTCQQSTTHIQRKRKGGYTQKQQRGTRSKRVT